MKFTSSSSGSSIGDSRQLSFIELFVRNGQFFSAFGPASGQNLTTIFGSHPCPEPVLVYPFSSRGLKCPFHDYLKFEGCKDRNVFEFNLVRAKILQIEIHPRHERYCRYREIIKLDVRFLLVGKNFG